LAIDLNPQKPTLVAYKCDQTYKYICKVRRNNSVHVPIFYANEFLGP